MRPMVSLVDSEGLNCYYLLLSVDILQGLDEKYSFLACNLYKVMAVS